MPSGGVLQFRPMKTFFHFLAALALVLAASAETRAGRKPNVLLIVADDLGYADVGFHGGEEIPTPNLDALAAGGVRFTEGYVSGPYCSPTRAGLLTGRYQNRFGHEFNSGGPGGGLPVGETTLPDRLKAAGYRTGMVGKWHLGSKPGMHPQARGFEDFFGFLGGAHGYFDKEGVLRGKEPAGDFSYMTDAFGDEAVRFINARKDGPWFLYLAFNAVHTPMDAPPALLAKFEGIKDPERRKYAAMLVSMDDAIGRVRGRIRELGLEGDTLVFFISDNGGPTMKGTTTNGSDNSPLRGSKRTTLEGGIRVPFVVSWPGRIQPGVFRQPVIQFDLHATALAAAGVDPAKVDKLEGVDLLPHLSGEKSEPPHEALFWRFGDQMAVRAGDWKLVRYDGNADTGTGRVQPATPAKLYHLAEDIHEDKDLAAEMPDKVRELQALWDGWNKANIPPHGSVSGGGGHGRRNR